MIAFYQQIKDVHIAMAFASVCLFALRGAGVLAGMRWPLHPLPRWSSYAIDSALLTAALMLVSILPAATFANGWLAAKLALLVAYVVLGTFAMRRARSTRVRAACYVAALATFAAIHGIARAHHPLGFLYALVG